MNFRRFSGIGRPLDFSWPTNVAIFLVTIAVGVLTAASGIWNGLPASEMAWSAVRTAGGVFLAWAICREIDPDHQYPAFVSAAVFLLWAVLREAPPLLPAFWVIMGARMLNRTTGVRPTRLDKVGFIALGAWLAFDLGRSLVDMSAADQPLLALGIAMALAVAFLPVWLATQHVKSVADDTGTLLSPNAVRRAQGYVLGLGLVLAGMMGLDGLALYSTAWAAVIGASTGVIGWPTLSA